MNCTHHLKAGKMSDTTKTLLGQRIQEIRKRAKLKQEYVAEQVGIDAKSLSRIEGGTRYPSLDTLAKLGEVLQVSLKDFFDFPDAGESPEALRQYLRTVAESLGNTELRQAVGAVRTVLGGQAQQATPAGQKQPRN